MSWPDYVNVEARLPPGVTCSDCAHLRRCVGLGFAEPDNTFCDFIPVRYRPRDEPGRVDVLDGSR